MSKLGPDFSTMWYDDSVKLLGDTFAIHNTKVKKVRDDFSTYLMKQNHK